MKSVIHVHQQKIKKGEPAIIVRTYKGSTHHSRIRVNGPVEIVHSPTPDKCGARVWIETHAEVEDISDEAPVCPLLDLAV